MTRIFLKLLSIFTLAFLMAFFSSCGSSGQGGVQVLPALKQAGLKGTAIFLLYNQSGNSLIQLDLASGQTRTLFAAPDKSWLATAEVSPDKKQILLAYAPPPPKGKVQLANTDLYLIPIAGSASDSAQPLTQHTGANESYTNPTWAPDGQTIYYTHTVPTDKNPSGVETRIERMKLGEGQPSVLIKDALWPRLSPDGTKMAYLAQAPYISDTTFSIANADGSSPTPLLPMARFPIVDAHFFSPDGKDIYFSAPDQGLLGSSIPQPGGWTPGAALGVQPVSAHNNPSDWFRISAGGGKEQLVARIKDVNMVGAFSPDGAQMAYVSQTGLFLMNLASGQTTQLATLAGMGSLNWLP